MMEYCDEKERGCVTTHARVIQPIHHSSFSVHRDPGALNIAIFSFLFLGEKISVHSHRYKQQTFSKTLEAESEGSGFELWPCIY